MLSAELRKRGQELLQSGRKLRALGFWIGNNTPAQLPHPSSLQDENWSAEERQQVIEYLRRGTKLTAYCGLSYCRFECGEVNMGAHDVTDGIYCWPEGLVHYLETHAVRLPQEFVEHVKRNLPAKFPDKSDIDILLLAHLASDFGWWRSVTVI